MRVEIHTFLELKTAFRLRQEKALARFPESWAGREWVSWLLPHSRSDTGKGYSALSGQVGGRLTRQRYTATLVPVITSSVLAKAILVTHRKGQIMAVD